MDKVVAIVGRPNVGKSTLFNRMIGKRIAIVHSESGVTRDRNFGEADWTGKKFFLIDTGGYVPNSDEQFDSNIRAQVKIAIEESDKVIFVVDAIDGLIPVDFEIAKLLRERSGDKKIFLVTNKADNEKRDLNTTDFFKLGLGEPFCVSALSGRNVADLLDLVTEDFEMSEEKEEDDRVKFAIIGRPNAGKSSIINAILKEERNIVTDIPGTTRDSIDSTLKYFGEEIVLIDTAGLTKASKIKKSGAVDFFSTVRTFKAIQRCNVAILVVDVTLLFENFINAPDMKLAQFKVDKQDARIIEDVANYKKGILVVINKWDLVEKDTQTAKILTEKIKEHLRTFGFLKMIYISALTKQRIHKVIEEAKVVYEERKKIIKTSVLNDTMQEEIRSKPPASSRGREVKINYITQLKTAPPVFAFFVNEPKLINENYKRFLENKMRQHFGFEGVPLTLVFKKKN